MVEKLSFSAVLPIYNETESIAATLGLLEKELNKFSLDFEIICVDDGSEDNSFDLLTRLANGNGKIKIIKHQSNRGYGSALKTGIAASRFDYIIITDVDQSYPIDELAGMARYLPEFDMVIGARVNKDARIPVLRRFPKWVLNRFASYLAGASIPDLNSGLRIFKKELALQYWHLFPKGFSFTSTITIAAVMDRYQLKYIPISYHKRTGDSSIHPITDTINFFVLVVTLTAYFNPFKVFLPLSIVSMTAFLLRAVRDIIVTDHFGGLTLILFMLGIQFFFFGMMLDIISKFLIKKQP